MGRSVLNAQMQHSGISQNKSATVAQETNTTTKPLEFANARVANFGTINHVLTASSPNILIMTGKYALTALPIWYMIST